MTWTAPTQYSAGVIPRAKTNSEVIDNIVDLNAQRRAVLTNGSGGALAAGDVCIRHATDDSKLIKTSSAGQGGSGSLIYVAPAAISNAAQGDFVFGGVVTIAIVGTVNCWDRLQTSATAGKAEAGTTNPFAVAIAAGAGGFVTAIVLQGLGGGAPADHLHQGTAGDGGKLTSPRIVTDLSDTNGNELLKVTATASAVNEVTLANAATGNSPSLSASGGDTNVGLIDATKGTGSRIFRTNGADRLTLDGAGNLIPGSAALATNATDGWPYLITSAGAPTGTPATSPSGRIPYQYDTTNNRLYVYAGGAWRYVPLGTAGLSLADLPTVPMAIAYHSGTQSVADSTWTALSMDSEAVDTDGIHSTSSNTQRLTAATAGKYLVVGQVSFPTNGTGYRDVIISYNGGIGSGGSTVSRMILLPSASIECDIALLGFLHLAVGDWVQINAFQNSGGSLSVSGGNAQYFILAMARLGA